VESITIPSEFLRSILDTFHDGVYFVDRDRRITYWNKGAERISGYGAAVVVGARCRDELLRHVDEHGNRLCQERCPLAATIEDGLPREVEVFLHHRLGHRVPVHVRVAPLRDPDGTIVGALEVFSDSSTNMAALQRAKELEGAAYVDRLTGVASRLLTEITLRARLDELMHYGWPFGILFIDIDQLKAVNDTLGHAAGDDFLVALANTLRGGARSFDLVGRWGGEEFVTIVANTDGDRLQGIAERFRRLVQESVVTAGGAEHVVTVSIGGTQAIPGDTVESLVARADGLMRASKQAGRNRVTVG